MTVAGEQRPRAAIDATGIDHSVTEHGPVASLAEAARARGLQPGQVLKTMVVRRAADDFRLVLVPGGRRISWPKLRSSLQVSRLSMPDTAIPPGPVSIGCGAHGTAFPAAAADLVRVLQARPRRCPPSRRPDAAGAIGGPSPVAAARMSRRTRC